MFSGRKNLWKSHFSVVVWVTATPRAAGADVEQREGRILRQGQKNAEPDGRVRHREILRCVYVAVPGSEGQLKTAEIDLCRSADVGGGALTYAKVKPMASGNSILIEKPRIGTDACVPECDGTPGIRQQPAPIGNTTPRRVRPGCGAGGCNSAMDSVYRRALARQTACCCSLPVSLWGTPHRQCDVQEGDRGFHHQRLDAIRDQQVHYVSR